MTDVERVLANEQSWAIACCDVIDGLRSLPDGCVHCVVTSPPYFALRDYGVAGQVGLEPTPAAYVERMVGIFREARRVLRDDGTLWLNIGDSYAGSGRGGYVGGKSGLEGSVAGQDQSRIARGSQKHAGLHETARQAGAVGRAWLPAPAGIRQKNLIGIPWMLAFALREDGWTLRAEIIWAKRGSMPESVRDRPSRSHEQVFLFSKSRRYFYDGVGGSEKAVTGDPANAGYRANGKSSGRTKGIAVPPGGSEHRGMNERPTVETRNARSVWPLSKDCYKGAHFAVMPAALVARCLKAGISEHGVCPGCGAPWKRLVKREWSFQSGSGRAGGMPKGKQGAVQGGGDTLDVRRGPVTRIVTTGWAATCSCEAGAPIPALVLDPFSGAGTVAMVARRLGARSLGFDLNPEYVAMAERRINDDNPLMNRRPV